MSTLDIGGTNVTSDATELNILDGSATTQSSVTLAGADGIIISDASDSDNMKQALVSDISTYVNANISLDDLHAKLQQTLQDQKLIGVTRWNVKLCSI